MLAHLRAARGDAALGVLRRLALAGGVEADALAANLAGLLLQSCEAGAGLLDNALVHAGRLSPAAAPDLLHTCVEIVTHVARHDPPLHNTRRFLAAPATLLGQSAPAGAGILVVLAAAHALAEGAWPWTFGAERHACPGRTPALLHAAQALAHALRHGVDAPALARCVRYRPLPNARVPRFHFPPGDTP
ncbi:cytochrome p450 oxidoreductase [Bordetella pertussis]|nr:cytochrome p450 oxidoreductase [Bordetella pertussis]CRD76180.1 cytochrome p450 oxidoreductase [Bordetella pertussis]